MVVGGTTEATELSACCSWQHFQAPAVAELSGDKCFGVKAQVPHPHPSTMALADCHTYGSLSALPPYLETVTQVTQVDTCVHSWGLAGNK